MFKLNPFQKRPTSADPSAQTQSEQSSTSNALSQGKRIPRSPHYPFTEDGIRKRAQKVYEKRVEDGLEGTPEGDWEQAIRELKWKQSPLGKFYQWTGFEQKKGWDLFTSISLPIVLFAGGSLFTYWNNQQQQQIADQRREQDLSIADNRAKQEILNKYLDQMAESLKDDLLKAPLGSEKFAIAQARTITTLLSLDSKRQSLVIQFLSASGLNQAGKYSVDKNGEVQLGKDSRMLLYKAQMAKVNLAESDLSEALLIEADLSSADLRDANLSSANLSGAYLSDANLSNAYLRDANLSGAYLSGANLSGARLSSANLSSANLSFVNLNGALLAFANLSFANLSDANLSSASFILANLSDANLREADLSGADLRYAHKWTDDQLSQAKLCFTALPEGSKLDHNRDCKELGINP